MAFDFERFQSRHIGPDGGERDAMLKAIGAASLDALIDEAIPARIRLPKPLNLPDGESEYQFLRELRQTASRNQIWRSYIGLGSRRASSSATSWKTPAGTLPTRRIRPKSRRAGSNRSSTSRQWYAT